jgi:PIN domain nuclease of toxin-antitoxin system
LAVLLDTHAFLWWCEDAPELSKKARRAISNEECLLSLASLWEISIKISLGKLKLPSGFDKYIPEQMALNGFVQLAIGFRHIAVPAICRGAIAIRLTGF